ncbi:hypothetical protein [Mucilaginibacter polytrichastri]|uniref:Outer membrane protein beta-barrel domain-containing protein n=1 Tax=Mucilaginibacter polytrichastri TaxID=1302689 RepID=A0A1Q6A2L1_9SPHI|nr:hypothetical protein [Mucilaginibacter polytrichastri]OKS88249.1 hypothetical protein RG47T_3714 [Mucilaginibacter polytrichastri]SFT27412.1 hypothetical protein SAMN04487890_12818 [Mucilaginibacter polytrichastri]
MKKVFTLILILTFLATQQQAYAGWPMGKQRFLLGTSATIYAAKDYWDIYGKLHTNSKTAFTSYTLGLFGSYGLSRRTDFIFSVPFSRQVSNQSTTDKYHNGLGDLQLGLSYNLINYKYKNYTSIYVGAIVPMYDKYDAQTLGLGMYGSEVKLMNTGAYTLNSKKGYYNLEAGYRQFFGSEAPWQFTYLAAIGLSLDKANHVSVDVSGVYSHSSDSTANSAVVLAGAARNYSYTRTSLTYGHTFSRRISLAVSGFYTLTGVNTGVGYGGSLQGSFRF